MATRHPIIALPPFEGLDSRRDNMNVGMRDCQNVYIMADGSIEMVRGWENLLGSAINTTNPIINMFIWERQSGERILIFYNKQDVYKLNTDLSYTSLLGSLTADSRPDFASWDDTLIWGQNSARARQYDGTTVYKLGVQRPSAALSSSLAAGALTGAYSWYYAYRNSTLGIRSDLSAAETQTLSSQKNTITYTYTTDTDVDKIDIYRTKTGGSVPYLVTTVNNNTAGGTSTYEDNNADSTLATLSNTRYYKPPFYTGSETPGFWNITEEYNGHFYYAGSPDSPHQLQESVQFAPWYINTNIQYYKNFNTRITNVKRIKGGLIVSEPNRLWAGYGNDLASMGDFDKISSTEGVPSRSAACYLADGQPALFTSSNTVLMWDGSRLVSIGKKIKDKITSAGYNTRDAVLGYDPIKHLLYLFVADES